MNSCNALITLTKDISLKLTVHILCAITSTVFQYFFFLIVGKDNLFNLYHIPGTISALFQVSSL